MKAYKVVALFSIGMFAYDSGLVLMPFEEAQIYFKLRDNGADAASTIEVTANDPEQAGELSVAVSHMMGEGYRVYDWKSTNSGIFSRRAHRAA